ncbi:MAG: O-antigen polymerase [bacterium]|nr:O-antigen polymerase [bacterium]
MNTFLFTIFLLIAVAFFYIFIKGPYKFSPLFLMLSAWMAAIGISRLSLSQLEVAWSSTYVLLIDVSLISFSIGFFVFNWFWKKYPFWTKFKFLNRNAVSIKNLRIILYVMFVVSVVALFMFYNTAGNFPLLSEDSDVFRFTADEEVPGLINYLSQLARIFIPLSFFIMFWPAPTLHGEAGRGGQGFDVRKHWDLVVLCLLGTLALILFVSRTQIFFVDLWIMALYLFIRKPNLKQALKFFPAFLLISVLVLAAVPLARQYQSYGSTSYLAGVTEIDTTNFNPVGKLLLPIYVGVSFNQQALLHAQQYYEVNPIQHGRVTLDPFTNILGLDQFASEFDLGEIFKPWWNTGTYLFPFVQDFGTSAFFWIPALIAGILTMAWRYWVDVKNFLSINLYGYAVFFIVMTVYLSFTVRAEMYMDLFLLLLIYLFISWKTDQNFSKI